MDLALSGIHHLTAITADASRNRRFYTAVLGMRLVKKTVNQDDTSAYHLFYGDGRGSAGSDITFFAWPMARERRGSHAITRTGLRITGGDTLEWWARRLRDEGVAVGEPTQSDQRASLLFEDPEGQRLLLVDDGGSGEGIAWEKSEVPPERQIRGLGPITISVPELAPTERFLVELLNMRRVREYAPSEAPETKAFVFAMGPGGPAAELHVALEPTLARATQGAGGAHHVAFRTPDEAHLHAWTARLTESGTRTSGEIDRYYFRSLYFREPSGVLFEIATEKPGFAVDEPMEALGERLSLPPFLEARRAAIEDGLTPL